MRPSFVKRREPGEKEARKFGRGKADPRRRVRMARVMSRGWEGSGDEEDLGWCKEWKLALPVPRGNRIMVGRAYVLFGCKRL